MMAVLLYKITQESGQFNTIQTVLQVFHKTNVYNYYLLVSHLMHF